MKIAVIIVTWNSIKFLDNSIGKIAKYSSDIYVIDNGSRDGTPEYIKKNYPNVNLIELPVNVGFSIANNYGIKIAFNNGFDGVFLINVDTIIDEDIINPLEQILENDKDIGIIGPVVVEADAPDIIQSNGGKFHLWCLSFPYSDRGKIFERRNGILLVDYVLGAAMLIRRELYELIGGFDEDYFPAYVEEVDLCFRAHQKGFKCAIHQGVRIRHIGKQSSGGRDKEFQRMMRNHFLFAIKHLGALRFFFSSFIISLRVLYYKIIVLGKWI